MGFPVGYSDLLLPKLVLHLLLLLGAVRRFLLWAFRAVGLGDLLDADDPPMMGHGQAQSLQQRRPEFLCVPAMVIEEVLPVVRFEELVSDAGGGPRPGGGCCAVCLYDIAGGEEVRRLSNCRHVFHRGCLDRWMEHDQRTCPLCRALLIPEEMGGAFFGAAASVGESAGGAGDRGIWASTGIPDSSDYDYFFPSLPSSPMPSPILFQPHQLLGGGYE